MPYVVCDKRKGNPKINVEVCRKKCEFAEECKAYNSYLSAAPLQEPPGVDDYTTLPSRRDDAPEEVQAV